MRYKLKKPAQFILIILIILSFSLTVFITFVDGEQVNKVDCYDRFGNKIIGEICEEVEFENQDILDVNMIMFIFLLFGLMYVSISSAWDYRSNVNFFGFEKQEDQQ